MEQQKKIILLLLIMFSIFMLFISISPVNSKNTNNDLENINLKTPLLIKNNSKQMPPMSSHDYFIEEYTIINSIMSEGMIISEYKKTFTNSQRNDYDIEATYNDFNKDFKTYSFHLKEAISKISELQPSQTDAQTQQEDTLLKLTKLYTKINNYENHNTSLKDTLSFLNECKYELSRINSQARLPN